MRTLAGRMSDVAQKTLQSLRPAPIRNFRHFPAGAVTSSPILQYTKWTRGLYRRGQYSGTLK